MTIAEKLIAYYESDDFKSNYGPILMESYYYNEIEIKKRIKEILISDWDIFDVDNETINSIYIYIEENVEDFIKDFSNYYVGHNSLESIDFGEQEEQLTGIYNHRTKKDYALPYLRKVFDDAGFYVTKSGNDWFAYYNLSDSGIHIYFDYEKVKHLLKKKNG